MKYKILVGSLLICFFGLMSLLGLIFFVKTYLLSPRVIKGGGVKPIYGTQNIVWQLQNRIDDRGQNLAGFRQMSLDPKAEVIYILSSYRDVFIIDQDGKILRSIDRPEIASPEDIDVAQDGTIWLVDSTTREMYQMDDDGNLLQTIPSERTNLREPMQIEISDDGNFYIYDSYHEGAEIKSYVKILDPSGNPIRQFPTFNEDKYLRLTSMVLDEGKFIYLADEYNGINKYDMEGNLVIRDFAGSSLPEKLLSPIALDSDGNLYVVSNGTVFKFDGYGNLMSKFGTRQANAPVSEISPPFAPGEFFFPRGLGVLASGDLIVADGNGFYAQVVRFKMPS